jgi:DNA-binding winged helix-turn-helix (wHTH) protein
LRIASAPCQPRSAASWRLRHKGGSATADRSPRGVVFAEHASTVPTTAWYRPYWRAGKSGRRIDLTTRKTPMGKPPTPDDRVFALHASRPVGHERLAALLAAPSSRAIRTPDFEIDLLDRCARFPDGEEARFSPRQWQLLELFVCSARRPITEAGLAGELFGDDATEEAHQVPVLILQLRRKLEPDVHSPRYVRSLDARTYLFDPEGGADPAPTGSIPRASSPQSAPRRAIRVNNAQRFRHDGRESTAPVVELQNVWTLRAPRQPQQSQESWRCDQWRSC